jgi:hypothetical protein
MISFVSSGSSDYSYLSSAYSLLDVYLGLISGYHSIRLLRFLRGRHFRHLFPSLFCLSKAAMRASNCCFSSGENVAHGVFLAASGTCLMASAVFPAARPILQL